MLLPFFSRVLVSRHASKGDIRFPVGKGVCTIVKNASSFSVSFSLFLPRGSVTLSRKSRRAGSVRFLLFTTGKTTLTRSLVRFPWLQLSVICNSTSTVVPRIVCYCVLMKTTRFSKGKVAFHSGRRTQLRIFTAKKFSLSCNSCWFVSEE